jgi:hypothetical protein
VMAAVKRPAHFAGEAGSCRKIRATGRTGSLPPTVSRRCRSELRSAETER